MIEGELALALFASVCVLLLFGFPVALTLGGTALLFASFGVIAGHFDASFVAALSGRIFGTITNETLVAVPLFILMGVTLERAKIAEELLSAMANALGNRTGGLGMAVIIVGALLAASTGIVGATVVTMGVLALPSMLRAGYDPKLATGLICATGTLGQIIPPSIALVLLGDIMSTAYQQAQLQSGIINTQTVSVGDLFVGSLVPGIVLVSLYLSYLLFVGWRNPTSCPPPKDMAAAADTNVISAIVPPLALITIVLGSIILGAATPTEAAGVGAVGAMILAAYKSALSPTVIKEIARSTMETTSMVFLILIGAALFSLVFRGFGGDEIIEAFFESLGGGPHVALLIVMLVMFLLGFILDFIEITFVVVPIVAPILLSMGFDPVWLGVMIAVNLQTSFLTPPFGFALFYLRGVADESVATSDIYRGVVPFVLLQLALLAALWLVPDIVTWLPSMMGR